MNIARSDNILGRRQSSSHPPKLWVRLLVSVVIALFAASACYFKMMAWGNADDFRYYWLAARALTEGHSPYAVVQAGGIHQLAAGFLYPLPAAILIVPFVYLTPIHGATAFVAVSSGLLAWGLSKDGFQRFPVFGTMPFLWAVTSGQFSPLIMAAALIPMLGFVLPAKPNLGLASFAAYANRRALLGCMLILIFSLLLQPSWPNEWLHELKGRTPGNYGSPMFLVGGFAMLAALLRWRRSDARLLVAMSILPQSLLFYDQLPLWLIPETRTESAVLGLTSYVGWFLASQFIHGSTSDVSKVYGPAILLTIYFPCLVMILLRPNSAASTRSRAEAGQ